MEALYDQDFYQWIQRNAQLLRERKFTELDIDNLVEELESMGRSQKRELISRLSVLIMHLLKWQHQAGRRTDSWISTIMEQRRELTLLIEDSPSLKHEVLSAMEKAYGLALTAFARETGISRKSLSGSCPYTFDQAMDNEFWPGENTDVRL